VAPSGTTTDESVGGVYDALAPIYDTLAGARPVGLLAADRLDELLAARGVASPAVLDLGCGTGTLLCALRGRHPAWRLCGVDISPGMLAVARGKLGSESVLWARARLPGPLPFSGRFDVCGAFYDMLNHLLDVETLAATFRTAAALLRPGGLLVFDLNNAFGFETWWRHRIALDVDGHHVDTALAYDAGTRTARAAIGLAHAGLERRLLLRQRCFSETEVGEALAAAGLTLEVAVPWSAVSPDSPSKTWFVAAKTRDSTAQT
jgi:SAM-dependent methyltransferase